MILSSMLLGRQVAIWLFGLPPIGMDFIASSVIVLAIWWFGRPYLPSLLGRPKRDAQREPPLK